MRLADLAAALRLSAPSGDGADVEVTGVTHQADWVRPGDAFVAVAGARFDGHSFIDDAVARGAVAVLGQGLPDGVGCPVPYVEVPVAREALADAAAEVAGHPSRAMTVVGVTGTDGKTTTSCLARHLLRAGGLRTGLLSTIGYELPDGVLRQPPQHFTTPEAPQVQQILAEMAGESAQAVVVETSSHALALDRVRAVDYDVAVWTNLTGEHLDFHGDMEGYFDAKARLVRRARAAVLNVDDAWFDRLVPLAPERTTYSAEGAEADWVATDVVEGPDDLRFRLRTPDGVTTAVLPMIGRFNVANALAALAAGHLAGLSVEALVAGLATFAGVPGRMEMVERAPGQPRVIVDFAHTPPSLEKALDTVRVTTEGLLWVVLGSAGGPRDPSKRAPLGAVATRQADRVVFTEEDHRDTPLDDILREMERGARETGRDNFVSVGDRVEAIRYAVAQAAPEDTVVLAGKGPEDTLERDTGTVPWDEMAQARAALALRP
ncbi:UDP-N-acetylmuramoyl-L-alanyl-D-glutamate--2,6-diaminopimelate ligase [Ornithinimicrobium sediminis]|uniref:UDP-N-acetylmuramoyl-L-alanyl-D-glutamate--2, 6-diaminopimelate ligase n=1 Tax=Ornithinimicrobium sediminis TaxID=2904603 RepID=UPI001E64CD1F|nr:UDP-N-acetylmuramoyl-L-alanyl-D-glutamate--2,6-diaminopimelate ligase [Ornithinimicrobium sediminis]MCE0486822.1 UDP-N-acetylmuramoyl-L-alanyl-D-glutamate--2,6-diaminopimelate ligase [Ornithinimicrobium sediminis]